MEELVLDEGIITTPTAELQKVLLNSWSNHSQSEHDRRRRIQSCVASVFTRTIDEKESIQQLIEALMVHTKNRLETRNFVLNSALRRARTVEQVRVVLEFARSIPDTELPLGHPIDTILDRSIIYFARDPVLWARAGATTRRASPGDRSIISGARLQPIQVLAQYGETPDETDGSCPVLEDFTMELLLDRDLSGNYKNSLAFDCVVWFSDLTVEALATAMENGRTKERVYRSDNWSYCEGYCRNSMSYEDVVHKLQQMVGVRDTLRPLIDTRRKAALSRAFSQSPLRLLPHSVMILCLEFVVNPSASMLWL